MDIDKVKEARNILISSVFFNRDGTLRYKDALEGIYKATSLLNKVVYKEDDCVERLRLKSEDLKIKVPFVAPGYNGPNLSFTESFLANKINELEERVQKVEKE